MVHDLSEAEKICACCGASLHCIGEERSEKLDIIPATARVIVHVRPKYACRGCEEGVKRAPLPPQSIPKSIVTPGLLAWVVTGKYLDRMPLCWRAFNFDHPCALNFDQGVDGRIWGSGCG